jgi:hypothetical protein
MESSAKETTETRRPREMTSERIGPMARFGTEIPTHDPAFAEEEIPSIKGVFFVFRGKTLELIHC